MADQKNMAAKQVTKNAQAEAKSTDLTKFIQYTQTALLQGLLLQADQINGHKKTIMVLSTISILLTIGIVLLALKPTPEPQYFGRDKQGHYFNLVPLNKNEVHLTNIRLWAERCVIDSLDLSFQGTLAKVNRILNDCFSDNGKNSYQKWLLAGTSKETVQFDNNSKIFRDSELGEIVTKEISMTASPKAPSRIRAMEPLINSDTGEIKLRWEVTFPILLKKHQASEGSGTGNVVSRTILVRTNNTNFEYGVAIDSYSLVKVR